MIVSPLLLGSRAARADDEVCFKAFGGAIRYVLNIRSLTVVDRVTSPVSGRVFGNGLAPCAGLSEWPLVGSMIIGQLATRATIAFRAFTVDADTCGAVDHIVDLTLTTGFGAVQIHNDRNNASNASSFLIADCGTIATSTDAPAVAPGEPDIFGNGGR
jgi:hypothetical protein